MKLLCDPLTIADLQLPDISLSQTRQSKSMQKKRQEKKRNKASNWMWGDLQLLTGRGTGV